MAGRCWCVLILLVVALSGCATRPAPDFGGRWKTVNRYAASAEAIPLYQSYVFHASPMDGTLKNMLMRWASDSKMFQQTVKSMEQLGPQAFKSRQDLENAAAAGVFEAKASGLTRIDHVLPNTNGTGVFLVQGEPGDPANRRVYMDKGQAIAEPIEKSTAQVRQETQNQPQAQQEREQRRTLGI